MTIEHPSHNPLEGLSDSQLEAQRAHLLHLGGVTGLDGEQAQRLDILNGMLGEIEPVELVHPIDIVDTPDSLLPFGRIITGTPSSTSGPIVGQDLSEKWKRVEPFNPYLPDSQI